MPCSTCTPSAYLAQRLRQLRQERNISVKKIAAELGVSDRTIYSWEHEHAQPSVNTLGKIAVLFSCSIADFFEESYPDRFMFTEDEFELINLYRALNVEGKALVKNVSRGLRGSMGVIIDDKDNIT